VQCGRNSDEHVNHREDGQRHGYAVMRIDPEQVSRQLVKD
jgi:hypothetical protein